MGVLVYASAVCIFEQLQNVVLRCDAIKSGRKKEASVVAETADWTALSLIEGTYVVLE